jgi:hypothetical protein
MNGYNQAFICPIRCYVVLKHKITLPFSSYYIVVIVNVNV